MRVRCNMREIRGKRSLSDMAALTGVSGGQLSEIETGRRFPSDKQLDQLEQAYGPVEGWYQPRLLMLLQHDDEGGS